VRILHSLRSKNTIRVNDSIRLSPCHLLTKFRCAFELIRSAGKSWSCTHIDVSICQLLSCFTENVIYSLSAPSLLINGYGVERCWNTDLSSPVPEILCENERSWPCVDTPVHVDLGNVHQ